MIIKQGRDQIDTVQPIPCLIGIILSSQNPLCVKRHSNEIKSIRNGKIANTM